MGRGGTPGTVVLGNGGKWPGTGTGTEGAPHNVRVQGAARRAGGPPKPAPTPHPPFPVPHAPNISPSDVPGFYLLKEWEDKSR